MYSGMREPYQAPRGTARLLAGRLIMLPSGPRSDVAPDLTAG
jgi:hypothetical protein